MEDGTWLLLPLWYAAFLLSVTCHEAGHALAARWGGDPTAYLSGQASLNPWPHIRREPLGTVLVPLISFVYLGLANPGHRWMIGWASAPYDPLWEDRHPGRASWMAAAGPAANALLAAMAFTALRFGLGSGVWVPPEVIELDRLVVVASAEPGALDGLGRMLSVLLSLNVVLLLFNLLPVPPLDGSAILAGFFPPARAMRDWMRTSPGASLIGLVVAWTMFGGFFAACFRPVLVWLYS